MSQRDPRIDPRAGDVVRASRFKNNRERHVVARHAGDIAYSAVTATKSVRKTCWITTWQDWCKKHGVDVIQVGAA